MAEGVLVGWQITLVNGSRSRSLPVRCASAPSCQGVKLVHVVRRTEIYFSRAVKSHSSQRTVTFALPELTHADIFTEENSSTLEELRKLVDQEIGNSSVIDDKTLRRFLRAQSMSVEQAAAAIAKYQNWRSEFVPRGYFTEADIPGELNANKSYLIKQDKKGHPILLTFGRNHVYNKNNFDEFKRFVVYALDKAVASAPVDDQKFVGILDMKGLGLKNLDAQSFIASFEILQGYYPDLLEKIWMINVPLVFNGLWKVVKPFVNESTRDRIVFVDNKKLQETLLNEVDVDQLPKEYGGNADLVLIQDAVVPNWPPK